LSAVDRGRYVVIPGIITVAVSKDIKIAAKCLDFRRVKVILDLALFMFSDFFVDFGPSEFV
jgi:hypothetical protein